MGDAAEVAALQQLQRAYTTWCDASQKLGELMDHAEAQLQSPPIGALRSDFEASIKVTRAAVAFVDTCPPSGPSLDGIGCPAFVHALFQTIRSAADLTGDLRGLEADFPHWLSQIGAWTPAAGQPPQRPTRPAVAAVLTAVDAWVECLVDKEHDRLNRLVSGGRPVKKSAWVNDQGQLIEQAHLEFEPRRRWWSTLFRRFHS